ncbi:MAG: type II secretion system F family protein [Actinomycetota bacterium]|jgi:tight adherence protein C|nr:type II secretion system F family protein [Actinomycetota bacterium]MDA3028175.1 type II secretion system F family protein [Actinomycetota bacterium]
MSLVGVLMVALGATLATRTLVDARQRRIALTPSMAVSAGESSERVNRSGVPGGQSRREALGLVEGTPESIQRLMRRQVTSTVITGAVVAMLVGSQPTAVGALAALGAVAGAWQIPLISARRRESERRTAVDRELTDAIGEMVMGVEAGLTLDAVITRYAERHRNALADEFRHFGGTLRAGRPRTDALAELRGRTPSPIMRSFVSAVEQNMVLGTPLAAVLRKQAEVTRRHRRQAAETRAAGVSMKMIFPTVFCILPVLMIVVVGPAIVKLVDVL